MLAFGPQHKSVQSTGLADGLETVFAASEQLMYIALMAYVEDETVFGRIKHIVHGQGELDDAQIWADVSACLGNALDESLADLLRQSLQLNRTEPFHIRR